MEPNEHDPILRRLHSLGDQPLDPEVAARHRSLLATVPVAPARSRMRPLMVGSLLAGSLLGGMGLAAANPGVLPDPAQAALHTVTLGAVEHPDDHEAKKAAHEIEKAEHEAEKAAQKAERDADKAARQAENGDDNDADGDNGVTRSRVGCPEGFDGNHGEYVSSVTDDPTTEANEHALAAHSECGKPVHPDKPAKPESNTHKPESPGESDESHGRGKPEAGESRGRSGADHPDEEADGAADDARDKGDSHRPDGVSPPEGPAS